MRNHYQELDAQASELFRNYCIFELEEVNRMGHDTSNVLPKEIKEKEVIEFLKLLGYYGRGNIFAFYKDEDYKYFEGVTLFIGREDDKDRNSNLIIETHTSIWCSDYDLDFQNYTVKQLKKRFGGYFYTDNGKGRYLEVSEPKSLGAQNGCYFAFFNLHNQFTQAKHFLSKIEESDADRFIRENTVDGNFVSLATNITTTYIVSIIENYFRETYVALLKYSDKKDRIFKNSKIHPDDMLDISNGEATIEKAIAYSKPFQNIHRIHSNFKEIDKCEYDFKNSSA